MDIDKLQSKLRDIDVDIPHATLRRWAYDEREIIPRPERYKHGIGSGKSGRAAKWSDEAFYDAAAVWAVLHISDERGPPPLDLIPHIKRSAKQPYESVTAGYAVASELSGDLKSTTITRESIEVSFGHPKSLGEAPAGWQELLTTWIATIEKAKRGISIKEPQQVRFHWRSVKVENGVNYEPEKVNDFDDDYHVSLHPSESGHDEIVIIIDDVDFRDTVARILSQISH